MLYFTTREGQHIVVLEPDHLKVLKAGEVIKSPDKKVLIVYTHDSVWLHEQVIANFDELSPTLLDKLIAESCQRPEREPGPYHPPIHMKAKREDQA